MAITSLRLYDTNAVQKVLPVWLAQAHVQEAAARKVPQGRKVLRMRPQLTQAILRARPAVVARPYLSGLDRQTCGQSRATKESPWCLTSPSRR